MKILFVNNWLPLFGESNQGGSIRSSLFIEALSKVADVDIISFRGEEHPSCPNCRVVYGKDIPRRYRHEFVKDTRLTKFLSLFSSEVFEFFYPVVNHEKIEVIKTCLKSKQYDFVACRYLVEALECGLLEYKDKLILDTDDSPIQVLYGRYISQKRTMSRLNRLFYKTALKKASFQINRILKGVAVVFHSNNVEKHVANSVFLHNTASVNWSLLSLLSDNLPLRITMFGKFDYIANKEGALYFCEKVWPKVLKKIPNAEFHIVGNYSDDFDLKSMLEKHQHVFVKGWVQSVEEEYRYSRVVVVPLFRGTGSSIKTIEAIAARRPIVSTPIGMRGFSEIMKAGEDYMMANNDDEFASSVISLLLDIDKSKRMADNAYEKYKLNWLKDKFFKIVGDTVLNHKK